MLSPNGRPMRKDALFALVLQDDSSGQRSIPKHLAFYCFFPFSGDSGCPAGQQNNRFARECFGV